MSVARFRRELLPAPAQFWKSELAPRRLSRVSRGWVRTTCPLHLGDNPTAFSVNLESGAFHCHACGAKGDMVSYVMQRDSVDFKTAAMCLGAWDDTARTADARREMVERRRQRERIERAADTLTQSEWALRLECRDTVHDCDRLLSAPGPWSEAQWRRAQAACALRDEYALPAYVLLSFGASVDRAQYILHPEARAQIAAAVRRAGYVLTADGRRVEVLQ